MVGRKGCFGGRVFGGGWEMGLVRSGELDTIIRYRGFEAKMAGLRYFLGTSGLSEERAMLSDEL